MTLISAPGSSRGRASPELELELTLGECLELGKKGCECEPPASQLVLVTFLKRLSFYRERLTPTYICMYVYRCVGMYIDVYV